MGFASQSPKFLHKPREHFDEEALAALAESIREVGVLQPVLVRSAEAGGYELIAGERRWRAARRVGNGARGLSRRGGTRTRGDPRRQKRGKSQFRGRPPKRLHEASASG